MVRIRMSCGIWCSCLSVKSSAMQHHLYFPEIFCIKRRKMFITGGRQMRSLPGRCVVLRWELSTLKYIGLYIFFLSSVSPATLSSSSFNSLLKKTSTRRVSVAQYETCLSCLYKEKKYIFLTSNIIQIVISLSLLLLLSRVLFLPVVFSSFVSSSSILFSLDISEKSKYKNRTSSRGQDETAYVLSRSLWVRSEWKDIFR